MRQSIRTVMAFDDVRAEQVLPAMDRLWRERRDLGTEGNRLFGDVVLPQDMFPRIENPTDYALWLFYAALFMRGGIVSEDPFNPLNRLRDQFPDMFVPARVAEWDEAKILSAFDAVGMLNYKRDEHAKAWLLNSRLLAEWWEGDPLFIFKRVGEFEAAFRRINAHKKTKERRGDGILGMRRKIFSLYVIWLQEAGLIKMFPAPIPVDFHAMRVLFATGVMRVSSTKEFVPNPEKPGQELLLPHKVVRITEDMVDQITLWTQEFIHRKRPRGQQLSHLNVNPALWCLSRDKCALQFQNGSRGDGTWYATATMLRENPGLWPRGYSDPCASCPLSSLCTGVMPNKPHYKWGLGVLMEREPYPADRLCLPHVDWAEHRNGLHKTTNIRRPGAFTGAHGPWIKPVSAEVQHELIFPDDE